MKTSFLHKAIIGCLALGAAFSSCDSDVFDVNSDPFKDQTYKTDISSPISVYVESQEDLSEYAKALRYSETFNALNQSTTGVSFTAFVPNNEAMRDFYARRGVNSLEELSPEYVRSFVLYHTVSDSIPTDKFVTMKSVTNLDGEVLAISIDPDKAGEATLNEMGQVVEMGIDAYNGKVYILSKALTPLVETVTDRVADAGSSIMKEALEATGWSKDLNTVADTIVEYGKKTIIKRYYTFLNVSDATFATAGINSLSDLKSRLASNDHRGVGVDSLLREYVSYHVMTNSYTVADLKGEEGTVSTKIMGSNAKNQVMALTLDGTASTLAESIIFNKDGESASLVESRSDNRAKNGYIHELDNYLPVWEPEQAEVIWDLGDYAEIKGLVDAEEYQPATPVSKEVAISLSQASCFNYESGDAGTANNSYPAIAYVTSKSYTIRDASNKAVVTTANGNDRIVFNVGYMGWVEMKTPTLVKGKYRVELHFAYLTSQSFMRTQSDGNGGLLRMTVDNREDAVQYVSPYTKVPGAYAGYYSTVLYDEIEFTETADHLLKMVVIDPAASSNRNFSLQFDYIRFIPVKE